MTASLLYIIFKIYILWFMLQNILFVYIIVNCHKNMSLSPPTLGSFAVECSSVAPDGGPENTPALYHCTVSWLNYESDLIICNNKLHNLHSCYCCSLSVVGTGHMAERVGNLTSWISQTSSRAAPITWLPSTPSTCCRPRSPCRSLVRYVLLLLLLLWYIIYYYYYYDIPYALI